MSRFPATFVVASATAVVVASQALSKAEQTSGIVVEDIFGRRIERRGLLLLDWEGQIANPAIKFLVAPPPDAVLPATAVLTSEDPRLAFDLPSEAGPNGPKKTISFDKTGAKVPVRVAILPDREVKDRDLSIKIELTDAGKHTESLKLPVHVTDQDKRGPAPFRAIVDFSQDKTGFFKDEMKRSVIQQAIDDWAYFMDGMDLDPVPAGNEQTYVFEQDGFENGHNVTNAKEYTGFLLYAYGIHTSKTRSGGEPSTPGAFQTSAGKALSIKRSGGVEIETKGNYNELGWIVSLDDADQWKATNMGDVPNDLLSIAHHEIGHSLIFNPANPRFAKAKAAGKLEDPDLRAYLGTDPKVSSADHLEGTIDPASRRGAYGFEYKGEMPLARWLLTKTDLLAAQAVGWKLRKTSALEPFAVTKEMPPGAFYKKYAAQAVTGGIPPYECRVTGGRLPDGFTLDAFTGELRGTPNKPGRYELEVAARDQLEGSQGIKGTASITISAK